MNFNHYLKLKSVLYRVCLIFLVTSFVVQSKPHFTDVVFCQSLNPNSVDSIHQVQAQHLSNHVVVNRDQQFQSNYFADTLECLDRVVCAQDTVIVLLNQESSVVRKGLEKSNPKWSTAPPFYQFAHLVASMHTLGVNHQISIQKQKQYYNSQQNICCQISARALTHRPTIVIIA